MPDVRLEAVAADLRTLEAADEARAQINGRIVKLHQLDAVDNEPWIDGETFAEIMSQPVHWERLHEARQLSADYAGRDGQERFAAEDRRLAESGYDLVASMRRGARGRVAQQQAATAARRLDQALQNGDSPSERRVLLDAAVHEQDKELRMLEAPTAPARPNDVGRDVRTLDSLPRELHQLEGESKVQYATRLQGLIDRGEI